MLQEMLAGRIHAPGVGETRQTSIFLLLASCSLEVARRVGNAAW